VIVIGGLYVTGRAAHPGVSACVVFSFSRFLTLRRPAHRARRLAQELMLRTFTDSSARLAPRLSSSDCSVNRRSSNRGRQILSLPIRLLRAGVRSAGREFESQCRHMGAVRTRRVITGSQSDHAVLRFARPEGRDIDHCPNRCPEGIKSNPCGKLSGSPGVFDLQFDTSARACASTKPRGLTDGTPLGSSIPGSIDLRQDFVAASAGGLSRGDCSHPRVAVRRAVSEPSALVVYPQRCNRQLSGRSTGEPPVLLSSSRRGRRARYAAPVRLQP